LKVLWDLDVKLLLICLNPAHCSKDSEPAIPECYSSRSLQQTTPGARTAQLGQQLGAFPGSTGSQISTGPPALQLHNPDCYLIFLEGAQTGLGIGQSLFGGGQGGGLANLFGGGGNAAPQGGSNWMMGTPPASGNYSLGGFNVF
jgi:hypothetical protein